MNPIHIFNSPEYQWVVESQDIIDDSVFLTIRRSLTREIGPKFVSAMTAMWGLEPDTAQGQWAKALCTSGEDPFVDWVKSFNKSDPIKKVIVFFPETEHFLVCEPGTYEGCVHVSRTAPKEFVVSPLPL